MILFYSVGNISNIEKAPYNNTTQTWYRHLRSSLAFLNTARLSLIPSARLANFMYWIKIWNEKNTSYVGYQILKLTFLRYRNKMITRHPIIILSFAVSCGALSHTAYRRTKHRSLQLKKYMKWGYGMCFDSNLLKYNQSTQIYYIQKENTYRRLSIPGLGRYPVVPITYYKSRGLFVLVYDSEMKKITQKNETKLFL